MELAHIVMFFLALSIVLIVFGSIVLNASNEIQDSTKKTNTKNSGIGVLVIGLIFFIGSAVFLADHFKLIKLGLTVPTPAATYYYF